ncbi:MAG: M20 family peptidase [Nannocystaceae bacterium]
MAGRARRWGLRLGAVAAALLAVLLLRAAWLRPVPFDPGPAPEVPEVDANAAAAVLSRAIAIPTVSPDAELAAEAYGPRREAMLALHRLLQQEFPRVHQALTREVVGELSLLYRWPGTDPTAEPILLLAHLDVVPVEPGTEQDWTHPPFSGAIADGTVWGRGALDDKTSVVAILLAIERLLQEGFTPRRTVVLAFGHDEELGGRQGAAVLAATLEHRGEHFAFLLDEGGAIVDGAIPGLPHPAAMVGIAEKGYASLLVSLVGEGGHSSMPPDTVAIQRLAAAIGRLHDEPMDARIDGPTEIMVDQLAPHLGFGMRVGLANRWLLDPLVVALMTTDPASHASVRTTLVPTMIDAGVAPNVLAQRAEVVLNSRILPGDTVADVLEHVRAVIDDPQIEVRCLSEHECREPTTVADIEGEGFALVRRAIVHTVPDAVVIPNLVVGGTDARHYQRVARDAFRFLPIRLRKAERVRLHGTDEQITVEGFADAVRFYLNLLTLAAG